MLIVSTALLVGCAASVRWRSAPHEPPQAVPVALHSTTLQARRATPEPTATPMPTPTPVPVAPLTGQPVGDPALSRRRIVAVKIDNAPPARPQLGLSRADVVYEMLTEGGITRFLALYQSQEVERVGPVRSARLTDIYLAQEWNFLFAYASAGITTGRLLRETGLPLFAELGLGTLPDGAPLPYLRDRTRPVPHNLFLDVPALRMLAIEQGYPQEVPVQAFTFSKPAGAPGPVRTAQLPYYVSPVAWRFDEAAGVYRRLMAGTPHVDRLDGQPVTAANVVVLFARLFTTDRAEPDSLGNPVLDTELQGEGRLLLLRDGYLTVGKWSRSSERGPTVFLDERGALLPLRPGPTWIHIVPTDFALDFGVRWS